MINKQPKYKIIESAKFLAEMHRAADPQTKAIYLARDPRDSEIRLVEVSDSVDSTGEVLPFRFRAHPEKGVYFESVIVLLNIKEWKFIEIGKLHLPEGWGSLPELEIL